MRISTRIRTFSISEVVDKNRRVLRSEVDRRNKNFNDLHNIGLTINAVRKYNTEKKGKKILEKSRHISVGKRNDLLGSGNSVTNSTRSIEFW